MHKIIKGKPPSYLINRLVLVKQKHLRNTRNKNHIYIKKLKREKKRGAFFYKTAIEYNEWLSDNKIDKESAIYSMKKSVKKSY